MRRHGVTRSTANPCSQNLHPLSDFRKSRPAEPRRFPGRRKSPVTAASGKEEVAVEGRQAWAWMRRGRRISEETAALALPLRWRHSRRWAGAERVCPPQNVAGTQAGTRPLACSRDHACTHTHARAHTHTRMHTPARIHTHQRTHEDRAGPGPGWRPSSAQAMVGPSSRRSGRKRLRAVEA